MFTSKQSQGFFASSIKHMHKAFCSSSTLTTLSRVPLIQTRDPVMALDDPQQVSVSIWKILSYARTIRNNQLFQVHLWMMNTEPLPTPHVKHINFYTFSETYAFNIPN